MPRTKKTQSLWLGRVMTNLLPAGSIRRLLVAATMLGLSGGGPGVAQGLPTPGVVTTGPSAQMPALGSPLRGAPSGIPLGTIQLNLGGLSQAQAGAIGAITTCPTTGATSGGLPGITGTTSTTIPFLPLITSPFAPPVASPFGTPATSQFGTPVLPAPVTSTTSPFGTSTMSGICSPTTSAQPATPEIPASSAPGLGAAYSDAAIPLQATEAGAAGLSPLISVPAPAITSSGAVGPP